MSIDKICSYKLLHSRKGGLEYPVTLVRGGAYIIDKSL